MRHVASECEGLLSAHLLYSAGSRESIPVGPERLFSINETQLQLATFRLQLVKLLQVFGKLVRFYHGAIRNVLMQGVGKGSIVVEFRQRL
ncbi:hypothetical protein TNCV_5022381 [Trichonephila clavipes]|nr:hypothetical protein TNCV_5022381 [Trichonephila clavipes]